MPGIIMDGTSMTGGRQPGDHQHFEGSVSITPPRERAGASSQNNGSYSNGPPHGNNATQGPNSSLENSLPPELVHISQGFFSLGPLINRATQQCWNDLTELINELADAHASSLNPSSHTSSSVTTTNGKHSAGQSGENLQKKMRILDFAQAKRADFIKILVLSQWSRRAADVSRLIDLQAFIRMRYDSYNGAILSIGEMKRDLIRAQTANPDLTMALEVLSTGRVAAMQERQFIPPKPLTPKMMLRVLRKINRTIRTRLVLHDNIPSAFSDYLVHDGRVTFRVPTEFEIDLSIAHEDHSSQFFSVDIRFLFSPSPPIPAGRLLDDLHNRVNTILMRSGLMGCYSFLHNLVLSNKITVLFHQAIELARSHWVDNLRVELVHRTLVVQYWVNKAGAKSWIEIGIKSGRVKDQIPDASAAKSPSLSIRWMRDNKETDSKDITFDTEILSMESILRSVTSLHSSHLLHSAYVILCQGRLYANGALFIGLQTSMTEPGDCFLDLQLTKGRNLKVLIEPVSGTMILRPTPLLLNRHDNDRNAERPEINDIIIRISRLRSAAVVEELESLACTLGWETVNPRGITSEDLRRAFSPNVLRFILFRRKSWKPNWVIAYTCGMDGDNWWVIQLRGKERPGASPNDRGPFSLQFTHKITGKFGGLQDRLNYASFGQLKYALSGMITIHANSRYLSEFHEIHHFPPAQNLLLGADLQVPSLFICFRSRSLPLSLRVSPMLKAERNPSIKDTIRLSFQGIDPSTQNGVMVAYGHLTKQIKDAAGLVAPLDPLISFHPKGTRFMMRFLVPVGQPMIIQLLCRLQQLERIIYTLELLKLKGFKPKSVTLSRVKFSYSADENTLASINFSYHEQALSSVPDPLTLLSSRTPLMVLHLSIDFHPRNPHRRIKESLTATLNGCRFEVGLDVALQLLTITLPMLRAVDHISTYPHVGLPGGSRFQVTARSAKVYHIRYPSARQSFYMNVGLRRDHVVWILKDITTTSTKADRATLETRLKERIYDARGDGWQGLGNGAIADTENVGNLLSVLDEVMMEHILGKRTLGSDNTRPSGGPGSGNEPHISNNEEDTNKAGMGQQGVVGKPALGTKATEAKDKGAAQGGVKRAAKTSQDARPNERVDFITID
ncbi:mediator complex subunit [Emmonsiellopsis sp. PD_33]|nr:mediator complex subunit [Emmonsiellopsis sp. PD_33]